MDLKKLHALLSDTTCQIRKGEEVERRTVGPMDVVEVYAVPHQDEPCVANLEKVDCEFVAIGVDKAKAERRREQLIELLNSYPHPERLAGGPSYIEVGAEIGDQGAAFQLFALGKVLGLWDVITPATLGFTGAEARQMAGIGFVMMTGYRAAA